MVQYELGPLLWALAKPNGKMRSSQKSALINTFEKEVPLVHLLPENTVKLFDAMVLIPQLPTSLEIFRDISDFILAQIMHHHTRITCLVSDQYDQQSIKDHDDRGAEGEVQYTANRGNQSISVQFRIYLHNSNNKLELIEFLINDWANYINTTDILKVKELYVAVRDRAYRIFCRNGIPFKEVKQELCSSQEADTKIFLSASFIISLGFKSVCIFTNDRHTSSWILLFTKTYS